MVPMALHEVVNNRWRKIVTLLAIGWTASVIVLTIFRRK